MSKTLAELRNSRAVSLPERTYSLCLSQSLVAEAQALAEEKVELSLTQADETDGAKRPRRANRPEDLRLAEIETRLQELFEDMREHTGTLRLGGSEAGEWVRWRDAHPARKDGADDEGRPLLNRIDVEVAYGLCDASALLADLGSYVKAWNDEPMTPKDWGFISANAAPGDLKALVTLVVEMHEGSGARAPKASLSPSPTSTQNANDSK